MPLFNGQSMGYSIYFGIWQFHFFMRRADGSIGPTAMPVVFEHAADANLEAFLAALGSLFDTMDRAYGQAAARYGFICTGCKDNCCRTRFHHHTFLEALYLKEGLKTLPAERLARVVRRAQKVRKIHSDADRTGKVVRAMCPLNVAGLCILYAHRPMICRLHGIPHELDMPRGGRQRHPGCGSFAVRSGHLPYSRFDRTPFYSALSELEGRFRAAAGVEQRLRMTVAEMVLAPMALSKIKE